ncbi:MAG TPA: pantetheine-phosphate adenylyltransferase [Candidatus Limnocylindrales bacterium]|nr:pantetheine-phosphate adenylyltransferase [Candidatus Limnocylindrales bacterium]
MFLFRAIYPGSFDPVTNGHLDVIMRASKIVDHLTVTILENPRKVVTYSIEERIAMLKLVTASYLNVTVDYYQGLLIDYAEQKKINIIIKGLRAISDFEFEFQMALVNQKLNPSIETLFMMTNSKYSYLSSSIVKEIAAFGGDISGLVPAEVLAMIVSKFKL